MKARDIVKLYGSIAKTKLDPYSITVLSFIYMGLEVPEELIGWIDELRYEGYLDENKMLTDKALALEFIGVIKCNKENEDLARKIRDIFPKIIIKTSGKPARAPLQEMCSKVKWFKENYDYSDQKILEATGKYIDFFSSKNYQYMQTSAYFICKEDSNKNKTSSLASWCENEEETENFEINI